MKKILLFILLTFLTVSGFSQNFTKFKRNRITVDTLKLNYWLIYRGDTIDFDVFSSVEFSIDSVTWHDQQVGSDIYFRLKSKNGTYYRQQKIWDGRTLDLDDYRIINVDTAINDNDAVNYKLLKDSIAAVRYLPSVYEGEMTEGQNNIDVGFMLYSTTLVFYNGNSIPTSSWSGEGTQIINIGIETKLYDNLKVKK